MHTGTIYQPNATCTHEREKRAATLSRGGERDARGGEEPNGGATQFWGEVDAGAREWRGQPPVAAQSIPSAAYLSRQL